MDKHSTLLRRSVNYGQKSFKTLAPEYRPVPVQERRHRAEVRPMHGGLLEPRAQR
jgi:hypothetical protein